MTQPTSPKHFLDLHLLPAAELRSILDRAAAMKKARPKNGHATRDANPVLRGRMLALVFEQPSTRTRVSFDVGMRQLGGETIFLTGSELQLGQGETIADTARVLSRYVDAIMIRTLSHDSVLELAEHATVPVINGLTKTSHPCQIMADILTFEEHRGAITGKTVTWCGDFNNVARSWLHAAARFGFAMRFASPEGYRPPNDLLDWARGEGANVTVTGDINEAVTGAHCVVTDTWVSLGDSKTRGRLDRLSPFQVTEAVMARAAPDALFMHCLPAHRGEEMTSGVIDGPHSVVWDEAENRLHAQKGILVWCLS